MALKVGIKEDNVKVQFATREGLYKQFPISENFYPKKIPFCSQALAPITTDVKTSNVKVVDGDAEDDFLCVTIGKELFYFASASLKQSKPFEFLNKRTYKGVAPSCHDINQHTASAKSIKVAIGFVAGQIQIVDTKTKESLQILNEDRCIEKSKVTCVKWYPGSENLLLSAHVSGFMYTYDISQPSSYDTHQYDFKPLKHGDAYSIFVPKAKHSSASSSGSNGTSGLLQNLLYKWVITTDGSGVYSFEFSPCTRFIAIVTQNGYLRIINHSNFELYGCMKSYFGGLLTCSWSPDGRFIVTGGEDDLITVWSFCQQCVIARGNGHKSWISDIAFDPFCCSIPSDADMKTFYNLPSVDDIVDSNETSVLQHQPISKYSKSVETLPGADGEVAKGKSNLKQNYKSLLDYKLPINCSGGVQLPALTNAMRRLRTYSNVSKLSRVSGNLEMETPSLCYRFGSVGQDSLFCLWEIDENTLFCSKRKNSMTQHKRPTSHVCADSITENTSHIKHDISDFSMIGTLDSQHCSNGGHQYYRYHHRTGIANDELSPLQPNLRSHSVPHSINSAGNSSNEPKHLLKSDGVSNGFSIIRKFSTIGSHGRIRKETKEHKRNLSLPHFGIKGSLSRSNSASSKVGFPKKAQSEEYGKILGTHLCPSLEETAMLEPLICKKVSIGRMTCLTFKQDCIITTCQDGYLQLWKRPDSNCELSNFPSHGASLKDQAEEPSGEV